MQCCMALDVSLDEVVEGNVDKLKKRYPAESLMSTNQKIVRRETYEDQLIRALLAHAQGDIQKHVANVEVYLTNPAGIENTQIL